MMVGTLLPFESEHLGRLCARLQMPSGHAPADLEKNVRAVLADLRGQKVAFVSARVGDADAAAQAALTAAGFVEMECLVTLACDVAGAADDGEGDAGVVLARPEDAEACAAVAGRSFRSDRFHVDPGIPSSCADALKAAWMKNDVQGRADAVLLWRQDGQVAGVNACLRHGDDAIIDLICTAPEMQRRGGGRALVRAGLRHYASRARRMLVGTQARNSASLNLYRKLGFSEIARQRTFHLHLS